MMTEEEVKAHAAAAQAKYDAMKAAAEASHPSSAPSVLQGLDPQPIAAPSAPVVSGVKDPFKDQALPPDTSGASDPLPPAAQVQSQMPVQDGSQEPVQVATAQPGQRVQTAAAFNVGPPPITAGQLANEANRGADAVLGDLKTANESGNKAIDAQADVEKQIADEQAPIRADHVDQEAYFAQQARELQEQADKDTKAHFDTLTKYNQEIADHVANQPTDLWGRAGINKVGGIIGLILGGLGGSATGGKNTVVDTIDAMVEQNLKQNQYKYEMLKGKVSTENQAYAQIMATSQNKQQAADRYRLIANQQFLTQLESASQQFAGPQAKARAMQMKAELQEKNVQLESKLYGDLQSAHNAAAQIGVATRQQDLQSIQLQADDKARKAKEADEQYLPEYQMPEGKHIPASEAEKLRQAQGGASNVQSTLSEMRKQARIGGVESVVANKSLQSDLKQALIKQRQLSNRVSKDEGALLDESIGFLAAGNTAGFLQLFGAKTVEEALQKAQSRFAKSWDTNIQRGYGYKPTDSNPFVASARGDFRAWDGDDAQVQPTQTGAPTVADDQGSPDVAKYRSRNEIQDAARAAQIKYSGYGGY